MWDNDWACTTHHWMWGFGIPFGGLWTLFLILLFFALIRRPYRYYHWRSGRSAGLDTLEERYARGEINRDEYLQKRKDMGG